MALSVYVPARSTLVILFRLARARLKAGSDRIALLTDAQLVSATEEMHKIADEIRDAGARASAASDIDPLGRTSWSDGAMPPFRGPPNTDARTTI
jgi:hypothetical protein